MGDVMNGITFNRYSYNQAYTIYPVPSVLSFDASP